MTTPMVSLLRDLAAHDAAGLMSSDITEIDGLFAMAVEVASRALPGVIVEPLDFAKHVLRHVDDNLPIAAQVRHRARVDLWFALACGRGDRLAIERFTAIMTGEMITALASLKLPAATAEEIAQRVCVRLLTADGDHEPRILDYGGDGELRTWVRVIALRTAISELRKTGREVSDDALLYHAAAQPSPAAALLRERSVEDLKVAFHNALGTLEPRERNLLRQHLLDGLTIDELGSLYRVHRVTAARWLAKARHTLWREVCRDLRARLNLSPSDVDSLLDGVRSTLDLSLERAFAEA